MFFSQYLSFPVGTIPPMLHTHLYITNTTKPKQLTVLLNSKFKKKDMIMW
jgi:hypothetical protein